LDYPHENDLERGAFQSYTYSHLPLSPDPLSADSTPLLLPWETDELSPDHPGQSPPPRPDYGIEFSDGLFGHLNMSIRIHGSNLWIPEYIDVTGRAIRLQETSLDRFEWREDFDWFNLGAWSVGPMSADPFEAPARRTMRY
jgi:hypothetical protein